MEWVEHQVGTGDNCTTFFTAQVHHRPIEPGTLKAFIVPGNALDTMFGIDGRKPLEANLIQSVNEFGGLIHLNFYENGNPKPPGLGDVIWVRYGWRPPRLRDARVRVMLKGKKEWVSVRELQDAFGRSDRPWPDDPGGHCRGPCRH